MTSISAETLKEAAIACFGAHWIEPLAKMAHVTRRTVERWSNGSVEVPPLVVDALRREIAKANRRIQRVAESIGADLKRDGAKKPPKLTEDEAGVLAVLVASANKRPAIYDLAPFDKNPEIFIPLEATDYGIGRGGGNRDPEEQDAWLAALVEKGYLQKHPEHRLWRIGPNFPKPTALATI